jgi:tRNA A-37 threonylcarbamoyl transferase component Bud32
MTAPADATEPDDGLLAEFLRQLESADDRAAVLRRWCETHPRLASELAGLASSDRLLAGLGDDGEPPPERLGDFRIVRRVGRGGMGVVYEALQEPFGRRVAVKTRQRLHFSELARARFLREQAVLARLHHTHVVAIFAAGQVGDVHYFAMPFIDGVSLREKVRALAVAGDAGRLDESHFRAAATLVADAADAVHHAHEKGVIHRDLTPANLMTDAAGHVWVLDFGLAGYLAECDAAEAHGFQPVGPGADLSLPGSTMGTLNYMAPEQLGGHADVRTDVWGLGAILYELLTLRRAYGREAVAAPRDETAFDRRRRELSAPPVPPRRLAPRLSRDLEAACLKCLRPRPEDRYATARDLAEDLRRHLRGHETSARPWGLAERVGRWGRRQPAHAGLTAMAAVLLLLLALVAGHVGQLRADNARHADKVARAVERQLQLAEQAVREASARPALRGAMADYRGDPAPLHAEIVALSENAVRWFRRPGEDQPFVNWFAMDPQGRIIADPYPNPPHPVIGQDFGFRDYAAHVLGAGAPSDPAGVYVSRLFLSHQDGRCKFAAVSRVRDGDRLLGLIAATVAVDSKLVALDLRDEPPGTAVIGPLDRGAPPGREAEFARLPRFVFALHRDYDGSGLAPMGADDRAEALGAFDADPQVRSRTDSFFRGGRLWLADYARAGDTHFVALAEQPYPWEVDIILWGAAVGALAAIAAALWWAAGRLRVAFLSPLPSGERGEGVRIPP